MLPLKIASILVLVGAVVAAWVLFHWHREAQRILDGATTGPLSADPRDVDRLFEEKRRRGVGQKGYDVPMEIDLEGGIEDEMVDGLEEDQDEIAPPPFEFDDVNPDHPDN